MKRIVTLSILLMIISCASCSSPRQSTIPLNKNLPSTEDNYTIVWVGKGESYRYEQGTYIRDSSNDYMFEVVQRRYGNTWKSVKNIHRIHPEYDGRAGDREQTMFFAIHFSKENDQIVSHIDSSLGQGKGISDTEFRKQILQFSLQEVSTFAPYNTMRISQDYRYEKGVLQETVELFKTNSNTEEIPFVKIEETAKIFRPTTLKTAPTVFQ